MTDETIDNGLLFYDPDCRFCSRLAARFGALLRTRGFDLAPLQSPAARNRLPPDPAGPLTEMRLLTADGLTLGGADALVHIAHFVWWGLPIRFLARLPGGPSLLRRSYRWIAARRHCASGLVK